MRLSPLVVVPAVLIALAAIPRSLLAVVYNVGPGSTYYFSSSNSFVPISGSLTTDPGFVLGNGDIRDAITQCDISGPGVSLIGQSFPSIGTFDIRNNADIVQFQLQVNPVDTRFGEFSAASFTGDPFAPDSISITNSFPFMLGPGAPYASNDLLTLNLVAAPEPASLSLLALAAPLFLKRRRH